MRKWAKPPKLKKSWVFFERAPWADGWMDWDEILTQHAWRAQMWCRLGIFEIWVKLGLCQWVEWKWVFGMPRFSAKRYRKIYKTGNVKLDWRKFFCRRVILLRKIFVQVFGKTCKKFSFLGFEWNWDCGSELSENGFLECPGFLLRDTEKFIKQEM